MANITFRLSGTWSEFLLHRVDLVLDRLEQAARSLFSDRHADFREAAQAVRVRRLAAHGCSGQAI